MNHNSRLTTREGHSTATVVLQIDGLCHAYSRRPLFKHLNAKISPGVTLIRGGDGSGKTSLVRLLAGALEVQTGNLSINDVPLSREPERYREKLFWTDPDTDAFESISALQFFERQRSGYPNFHASDAPALRQLIKGLGLLPHMAKPIYMLSSGTRRKVWLAAAFSAGASVTLLDDPFAALDNASILFVTRQLQQAALDPARALVVTHYDDLGGIPLALTIDLDELSRRLQGGSE